MTLIVTMLSLPFVAGYVVSQWTGRPSRLYSSPIFWSEAVVYLAYAIAVDLRRGSITAERYGVRKTYVRSQTPVDYWFVIVFQLVALTMFAWLDWGAIARLLA